jgi:hypothetical protein
MKRSSNSAFETAPTFIGPFERVSDEARKSGYEFRAEIAHKVLFKFAGEVSPADRPKRHHVTNAHDLLEIDSPAMQLELAADFREKERLEFSRQLIDSLRSL